MNQSLVQFQTISELAETVAEMVTGLLMDAVRKRGCAHLVLSGGGTPKPVHHQLVKRVELDRLDWSLVHIWWADERAVPSDADGSNYKMGWETLLSGVPIDEDKVHRMQGELPAAEGADRYADELRVWSATESDLWPRMDVVLLGMGRDGHTASLFPGRLDEAELTRPVISAAANYDGRPAERMTLTPLVFNSARQIIYLVTGAEKGEMLAQVWGSNDKIRYPTQRIDPIMGTVTWCVDAAAGDKIGAVA